MNILLLITNHYEENFDRLVKTFSRSRDFFKEDAEDAVQNGYERAICGMHTYNPSMQKFDNWIGRTLYNAKKNHYNRYIKGRGEDNKESEENLAQPEPEPSTKVVQEVLDKLTPLEVRIWKMHKESGYSRRLTAKVLGINENKVRNTISKMWRKTVV